MNSSEVVFAVMITSGKQEYAVDELLRLCAPFDISETLLRTSLSRMAGRGLILPRRDGKNAYYRFSPKAEALKRNVGLSFHSPDWRDWDGKWWGVSFSVPDLDKPERHHIRTKLAAYRFISYHPGFWIRPFREADKLDESLETVFSNRHCRALRFEFLSRMSREEISRLWKLDEINKCLKNGLLKTKKSRARIPGLAPAGAFKELILTGDAIVNILFKDPLLPDVFLPKTWAAKDLKKQFSLWYEEIQGYARPFLDNILNGGA